MDHLLPQLLFVDNEEAVLRFVKRYLPSIGYDAVTSLDWDEAKSLLKHPS